MRLHLGPLSANAFRFRRARRWAYRLSLVVWRLHVLATWERRP